LTDEGEISLCGGLMLITFVKEEEEEEGELVKNI